MIKFENISVSFRGEDLFGNLNLEIQEKAKVLITGKSGYGKSTLFAILLGFYKPNSGHVYFNGKEVTPETAWEIRREIAYVDQEASLAQEKVSEWFKFVESLKANQGIEFKKEEILELFDKFELPKEVYNEDVTQLSGGEKQRIALITAVMLRRKVILLDEPTSALDINLKEKIIKFFVSLKDVTVIVISHDEIWKTFEGVSIFNMERKEWER